MFENIKMFITVSIGLLLFIRGYLRLFKKTKSIKEKFIEKAKNKGHYITATHINTRIRHGWIHESNKSTSNRNDMYIVNYKYMVNGKEYYKKLHFQDAGMASCNYPLNVVVYYNPERPRKAYCIEELDYGTHKSLGCFTDIAIAFIAMWAIKNILSFYLR